ncbi:MAG TPA: response regulator [bacterium]|nr:response regulator [bacterium]
MANKREHQRLDVKGVVKYRIPENMDISIASLKNISAGGVCVLAQAHLEPGTTLKLVFQAEGIEPSVARAEVRWSEKMDPPSGKFTHRAGLQFLSIDPKRQEEITSLIVSRLKIKVQEEAVPEINKLNRPLTILVIDDDRVVLRLVEDIFKDSLNVITAPDGFTGVEKAREWRPDLILLDLVMPDMDGFSTLMMLKDIEETKHIPVVMLSVVTHKSTIFQAMQSGASDYILKPFTSESLLRKMKRVLERGDSKSE